MARLRSDQWADIRAAWIGTDKPIRELAREFGVTEAAIRHRAEKEAWGTRNANGRKREIVVSTLAGIPQSTQPGTRCENVEEAFQAEADADIEVMRIAGGLFVKILHRANSLLPLAADGREVNALADASRKALDGYRRVRGLDEPPPPGAPVVRPYSHLSDEELAREIREADARQG
jgi:hypothetical protein